ncbi:hypothetical protein FQN60_000883 [Etheostoma spectabile]|uniref:Uncharacterized protein n=1 Tax=Etheostoma spectabile TaxID=54343 RepID=A0A5J5CZF5_9PERO|nr:hypothetical protein FQN60_000883 [Etheostoma spectabile]
MKQFITNGRTGTGDMFPGISVGPFLTEQIPFRAKQTLPLQAIDERVLAVLTERHLWAADVLCQIIIEEVTEAGGYTTSGDLKPI